MFNSIRFKLLFLAISGSALSVAIAGVAWLGVQNITSNSGELMVDLQGVQNHMQLDMMHDALRGDVLRAILDAQDGGHSRGDVQGAVKEHAAELRKMLDLNLKLALPEQVIAELQRAKAPLETYAHSAEEFVDLAYTDLSAARASMGKFQAAFEGLEGVNESITELMDTTTDAAQKADEAAFETTQRYVLLSVLVGAIAAFGLTIFGIYTANSIARPIAQATGVLEQLAAGDFTGQLGQQSITELSRMSAALDQAIIGISQALSDVNSSASQLAVASQQVSTSSAQMSDGAQQQASALEETAASLEEITGTIKQNADSARQASQLAQSSREIAERGGRVVGQAVDSIKEINRSSEKIANIITTIDEIAFQTNLLALNAAVEAARAGEQGRGFAVVASEVRNLAQRSASSAKEIKALIEESLQKVSAGSELVDKSGQSLQEIVASVKRVTEIIAEIAAASQEQATGVDQVNRAVTQMDQVVQGNAGQTSQLASTANALAQQATELQTLVGRFQLADGTHATQHYAPAQNFAPAAPAYTPAPPTLARAHSARRPAQHVTTEATVPAGGGGDEGFIEF